MMGKHEAAINLLNVAKNQINLRPPFPLIYHNITLNQREL